MRRWIVDEDVVVREWDREGMIAVKGLEVGDREM